MSEGFSLQPSSVGGGRGPSPSVKFLEEHVTLIHVTHSSSLKHSFSDIILSDGTVLSARIGHSGVTKVN